jgi:hypothetical protein
MFYQRLSRQPGCSGQKLLLPTPGLPTNVGATGVCSKMPECNSTKGSGRVADRHWNSQRDGIRSATASPQRQEYRFAHSQMITDSTEQLTKGGRKNLERPSQRRSVAISRDNEVKTFSVYL